MDPAPIDLVSAVLARDVRSVARALRFVDDRVPGYLGLLKALYPHTGNATIVGVTGNPGAGKSTLSDQVIAAFRSQNKTVGIIAVDPTSPYTGGAIFGDRIRMGRHTLDSGVFIRSVATRGHMGGLSRSARDMVRVLDAAGSDVILIETVGVGQDELEVTRTAHSTLVVMAPGLGDDVQAIKAGILECADVFVVNKADRDGADGTVRDLELMISLGNESILALSKMRGHATHGTADGHVQAAKEAMAGERWTPPILRSIATRNQGTEDILSALEKHQNWLSTTEQGRRRRRERLADEIRYGLREALIEAATATLGSALDDAVLSIESRVIDPYSATEQLIDAFRA